MEEVANVAAWLYRPLQEKVAIENLDPSDILLKITPGMVKEHIARYQFVRTLLDRLDHKNGLTIVDAASGRGYGADILRQDFPPDTKIIGVELGSSYVKKAKEKYNSSEHQHINFLQGDVRKIPVVDQSADVVTAFEITEHLSREDQPQFLAEVFRVLKPGGYAVFSIPERVSFRVNQEGKIVRSGASSNPHHLHEPTREEMKEQISHAGLKLVGEYGQGFVDKQELGNVKSLSQILPVYPFYQWTWPRDVSVKPQPEGGNTTALVHLFIAQKKAMA